MNLKLHNLTYTTMASESPDRSMCERTGCFVKYKVRRPSLRARCEIRSHHVESSNR